jgi:hypothetical protein
VRKNAGGPVYRKLFNLMIEPILQPSPSAPQEKASCPRFGHLDGARQYLRELAAACLEGARSPDPRVVWLALGLVDRLAVRPRRGAEVFSLTCRCGKQLEIKTSEPHRCPRCGRGVEIQWQA